MTSIHPVRRSSDTLILKPSLSQPAPPRISEQYTNKASRLHIYNLVHPTSSYHPLKPPTADKKRLKTKFTDTNSTISIRIYIYIECRHFGFKQNFTLPLTDRQLNLGSCTSRNQGSLGPDSNIPSFLTPVDVPASMVPCFRRGDAADDFGGFVLSNLPVLSPVSN